MTARELFGRHLDLRPLGHRRRGRVLCIFHRESTPSLSVDLDNGVFHCFGCGNEGGMRRFAVLVGELTTADHQRATPHARSAAEEARAEVLRVARLQPWARGRVVELYAASDAIRAGHRRVRQLRSQGTMLGRRRMRAWELLATAAAIEIQVHAVEADCDALMARARE